MKCPKAVRSTTHLHVADFDRNCVLENNYQKGQGKHDRCPVPVPSLHPPKTIKQPDRGKVFCKDSKVSALYLLGHHVHRGFSKQQDFNRSQGATANTGLVYIPTSVSCPKWAGCLFPLNVKHGRPTKGMPCSDLVSREIKWKASPYLSQTLDFGWATFNKRTRDEDSLLANSSNTRRYAKIPFFTLP